MSGSRQHTCTSAPVTVTIPQKTPAAQTSWCVMPDTFTGHKPGHTSPHVCQSLRPSPAVSLLSCVQDMTLSHKSVTCITRVVVGHTTLPKSTLQKIIPTRPRMTVQLWPTISGQMQSRSGPRSDSCARDSPVSNSHDAVTTGSRARADGVSQGRQAYPSAQRCGRQGSCSAGTPRRRPRSPA